MANPNAKFSIFADAKVAGAFGQVRGQMRAMQRDTRAMGAGIRNNRRIIQQAGMQLSDFAVQVGGGQSAILAFTQNVPQFVQGFGAMGGVLAALITIFGTLALVMVKTGTSLSEITPLAGILADEFQAITRALGDVKEFMIDTANVLINNLDRVAIYAATVVGIFAVKWVVGFVAARGAVNLLIGSLLVLRATLIRLGFTAIIVAIGEAVYQFSRLVKATGGWSLALIELRSLAVKVWDGIKVAAQALGKSLGAVWMDVRKAFSEALKWMAQKWADFVSTFGGGVNRMDKLMGGTGDVVDVMGIQAWASSFDGAVVRFENSAARLRAEAKVLRDGAFAPLADELMRLAKIMELADKEGKRIDIRDWFGGKDDDEDDGSKVKDTLTDIQKQMKSLADTIKSSMSDAFHSVIDGTKSVKDAFADMARSVIKKLYDILVVQQLVGDWDAKSKTGTGLVGVIMGGFGGLFSADGGGFTGSGPRTGGVDGRGGFPAILHPNETVVDHTKGQSAGGTVVVQQTINVTTGVQQTVRSEIMSLMPQISDSAKAAVLDARRRGGAFRGAF